jgi:hypothetical protein
MRPYLKKPITKKIWMTQSVGPEFKPQYCKKAETKSEQTNKKLLLYVP